MFLATAAGIPGLVLADPRPVLAMLPIDSGPIPVGSRKQLFFDGRFIESSRGVRLKVNPPVKAERVLLPEKPWETKGIHAYSTILEHDGVYKMWYDAFAAGGHPHSRSICYATSRDGIQWARQNVNLFEWEAIRNNNIVMPGTNGSVMIDPNGPDEHRFKALVLVTENSVWPESQGAIAGEYDGKLFLELYLCTSPDGIRWRRQKTPALPFFHDTQNHFFFDTRLRKYVAYVRTHEAGRTVGRTEFDDPLKLPWPFTEQPGEARGPGISRRAVGGEFHVALARDESDPTDTDLYTPSVVQYPWAENAYLSFPSAYRHYRYAGGAPQEKDERGRHRNDGPLEIQLAVSRDGLSWSRPDRRPYVPLGLRGSWGGGQIYMALGMIRKGSEIWQYYSGTFYTHGAYDPAAPDNSGGLCRLVQRLDGFMSADAEYTGAELVTPLLTFSGGRLELNIDCSAMGEAWVEMLDEHNRPIPGHRLQDSIGVDRNDIAAQVRWKEREDASELAGRPVRLHFKLRACKLYAFQFQG